MSVQVVSILGAVIAVCFGAMGPALAEGRAIQAAMEAIARQPEAGPTISRSLFVGSGHDRGDGDLLLGRCAGAALR